MFRKIYVYSGLLICLISFQNLALSSVEKSLTCTQKIGNQITESNGKLKSEPTKASQKVTFKINANSAIVTNESGENTALRLAQPGVFIDEQHSNLGVWTLVQGSKNYLFYQTVVQTTGTMAFNYAYECR